MDGVTALPARRWPKWLVLAGLVLIGALAALPFAIDTVGGRAWLVRQLPALVLENGLSFRVGRIDGSLWHRAELHDVAIQDQNGGFARIDALTIDWQPLALLSNRFVASEMTAPVVQLNRLPSLKPTADPRILPAQDISIDRLMIGRLVLAAGLAGPQRNLTATGRIDLHAGRALVDLDVHDLAAAGLAGAAAGAVDSLALHLDANPDRDRFALTAQLTAPGGGVVTTLAGLAAPLAITVSGQGRWQLWDGRLAADLGGAALARLVLSGRAGVISAGGTVQPAQLLSGVPAQYLAEGLNVAATATAEGEATAVTLTLANRMVQARLSGRVDRASERLSGAQASVRLADGAALSPGFAANGLVATARLAGPLLAPIVDARVMATNVQMAGSTPITINQLSLAAIADLGERPANVPVAISAASISGLPPALMPLAGKWQGNGRLRWQDGRLSSDGLTMKSGPLSVRLAVDYVARTAAWTLGLAGEARGWVLPVLGSSDASFRFALKPGGIGSGNFKLTAAPPADSGLTTITGNGVIAVSGRVALGGGQAISLTDLAVASSRLAMAGRGSWQSAAGFTLAANGRSRDWGAFELAGRGSISAPAFTLHLPQPGYGITAVVAELTGGDAAWRITAAGEFGGGRVDLQAGVGLAPAIRLSIDRLAVAGFVAKGVVEQSAAGPFVGDLAVAGQGLEGGARLFGTGNLQKAEVALAGNNANFALATPISIDGVRIKASISLPVSGPQISGNAELNGLERGTLTVEKAQASLRLVDGRGSASFSLKGESGAPFRLGFTASIAPGRWQLAGDGEYDDRQARLSGPATITHDDAGWHLAPVTLASALGNAEVSGDWGEARRVKARLDKVSLALVALVWPSVNISGRISGDMDFSLGGDGGGKGKAALRLTGLSRSNTASTSAPVDVGLNAALDDSGLVMRAVMVRAGKVEGRAQAQVGPVPVGDAALIDRLGSAGIIGQLRYAGPAQDLWGLSGLAGLDVRGDLALAADVKGTLGNPQVIGQIRGSNARVEAPLLGAVASNVSLEARFTASRLELTRFSGTSGQGSISGSGSIDLSLERGFPIDIRMQVKDAAILGRDDLMAVGSGNIRLATDEYGGVVSGTLTLSRGDYRIGRGAVADVPVLEVSERNTRLLGRRIVQYVPPTRWLYNLNLVADRRLMVTGMGIKSEWQANIKLRGGATAPELFGRVQLVRGDYDFSGKRFQLTRGDIRFVGGYPPDPLIAVAAQNSDSGFTALLTIDGTAQRPLITFSSVPVLPEDEVLSRVLFGSRVTDLSAPEAIQLAGALSSLGGRGFNPIGAVSKGLGIDRLRILPADVVTGRKTTFAAGQYLGRHVYVELATDAQGYSATSIELGLTRSLSVLSSVATLGGTSLGMRWKKDY